MKQRQKCSKLKVARNSNSGIERGGQFGGVDRWEALTTVLTADGVVADIRGGTLPKYGMDDDLKSL